MAHFTFLPFTSGVLRFRYRPPKRLILPFYLFTIWTFYLWLLWGLDLGLKTAHFTFFPFYLGVLWGPYSCLKTALFTFLPGGALRSRLRPQDGLFHLFTFKPFYLGVRWGPDSGLKKANLPFYLGVPWDPESGLKEGGLFYLFTFLRGVVLSCWFRPHEPLASYRCTLTKCETSIIYKLSTLAEPSKRANKDVFINQTDIICSSGSSSNL